MIVDDGLTFREIVMNDPLPKSTIQQAVFEFLKRQADAALFGAMAVNAYIDQRRMTEDVNVVSSRASEFADELRQFLSERFNIAVRVRAVRGGIGFRIYQVTKPKNRQLVDVRSATSLPPAQRIDGVLVVTPSEVIAGKVVSYVQRKGQPKSFTDRRDLAHMLLQFPELKVLHGPVEESLIARSASDESLAFWRELVAEEILAEEEDDKFD